MTSTFDPGQYKRTTEAQWQQAADAWHRYASTLHAWLGESTELMLDMAKIGAGHRVLDVAAGAGEQTIAAARRVGEHGYVLASDIASKILAHAADEARRQGLSRVETRVMDGEALDVPEGSFDAVVSRVGLIYFPDRQRALRGMYRALRPGGRLAAIVYSTPERNAFFSIPVSIIRRRAHLGPPAPGQPGPFSLGAPGVIEAAYAEAGFREIEVRTVSAPLRMKNADECVQFEKESFGALHQMLSGLSAGENAEAWAEITRELRRFDTPSGFEGPCELLVAAGTK